MKTVARRSGSYIDDGGDLDRDGFTTRVDADFGVGGVVGREVEATIVWDKNVTHGPTYC